MKRGSIYLSTAFIFFAHGVLAQCSIAQEKEIKLSNKYYYGETINVDTSTQIKLIAKNYLIDKIADAFIKENVIIDDSSVNIAGIEYCVCAYGKRHKIIAYVPIDNVSLLKRGTKDNFNITRINPSEKYTDSNPQTTKNDNSTWQGFVKQSNVIDSLQKFTAFSEIRKFLSVEAGHNKLEYSEKEQLVSNIDNCYVIVLDKNTNKLLACMSKGKKLRLDILNNKEITDYKNEYKNSKLIWVNVY